MIRRLFNFFAGVSLALCVAVGWLYARQVCYGGGELQLGSRYFATLRARYAVRADVRGVWVYGPPHASAFRAAGRSGRASSLVAKLRGSDIEWPLYMDDDTGEYPRLCLPTPASTSRHSTASPPGICPRPPSSEWPSHRRPAQPPRGCGPPSGNVASTPPRAPSFSCGSRPGVPNRSRELL